MDVVSTALCYGRKTLTHSEFEMELQVKISHHLAASVFTQVMGWFSPVIPIPVVNTRVLRIDVS